MGTATFIPALRFEALTPVYDPVVRVTTRETAVKRRLALGLGERPRRILDVGCGTGTLLSMLEAIHPTADLVGLDVDPRMLGRARRKVGARVDLVQGDATALPFPSRSFDRVVSSLVFHHLTRAQKLRALRSIRGVLAERGELHLADFGAPHGALMRALFLGPQCLDGFETTRDHAAGKLPGLLEEAGFREVTETVRTRTLLGTMAIYVGRA